MSKDIESGKKKVVLEEPLPNEEEVESVSYCVGFSVPALESLYLEYSARQKYDGLRCFLIASILFDIFLLTVPGGSVIPALAVGAFLLLANITLLLLADRFRVLAPHIAWLLSAIQLLVHPLLRAVPSPHESLAWAILQLYLTCVALPLRLPWCVGYCISTAVGYLGVIAAIAVSDAPIKGQIIGDFFFLFAGVFYALVATVCDDRQQRQAFMETRQSLEVKLIIEEQSAEQERLLLSVLPEHVAVKMRQDLGATEEQFKKIYMSRHENVSILYADIVGFTAISSTYSAQDLVAILNELFARFDRLAEKYQQLRIKILGDCYYCISGAPVERLDHAVLCVHMGLSMVKAIKYVQQTTNSPVDMRVGIHTGAVLAGVLGQRQWQFDVYSKDVELANKMESSGMAGKVHVSETTLGFLNGAFEVEPAHGERREESLRQAGLKTFFIVKVLKPYQPSKLELINGGSVDPEADNPSELKDEVVKTPEGDEAEPGVNKDSEDFNQRLREELMSKDDMKTLCEQSTWWLTFRDATQEALYSCRGGGEVSTAALIVLPPTIYTTLKYAASECAQLTYGAVFTSIASAICGTVASLACFKIFKFTFVTHSAKHHAIFAAISIVTIILLNVVSMIFCAIPPELQRIENSTTILGGYFVTTMANASMSDSAWCRAAYFSHASAAIASGTAYASACALWLRATLMAAAAAIPALLAFTPVASYAFDAEDRAALKLATYRDDSMLVITPTKYKLGILVILTTISFIIISRHVERRCRLRWLGRTAAAARRERASDMRRRNAALVRNVLPPRVAVHFLGRRRRADDLYSESVATVGVLFASMPNFSDFYSEETVNNQGLECLRFLNEVISDFDMLLEKPQYKEIIKIKTIGSTYMAASGLNPSKKVKSKDPVTVRWAHLALLVEFALELKQTLQGINEQSFNHFVLKMGINHGPITAGVIGARKPHYDIWGNTVNVASRMESTGKAGCIQVTEETCHILQQFGYVFEQRGLVAVKGKGQLMTYYLQGKNEQKNGQIMATLKEEDESTITDTVEANSIPRIEIKSPNSSVGSKRTECNGGMTSPKIKIASASEEDDDTKVCLLQEESEPANEPKESEALLAS